jgi:hypothetical protein
VWLAAGSACLVCCQARLGGVLPQHRLVPQPAQGCRRTGSKGLVASSPLTAGPLQQPEGPRECLVCACLMWASNLVAEAKTIVLVIPWAAHQRG